MVTDQTIPRKLPACQAALREQIQVNTQLLSQQQEMEKKVLELEKFITYLVKGEKSERRVPDDAQQPFLPFQNQEEFEQARAEAEAEADAAIKSVTEKRRKRRECRHTEGLPAHLRREEITMEAAESVLTCCEHGARKLIGYDVIETLMRRRAELYVLRKLFPKYACECCSSCGIVSPERPTSLVEGDRYSPSVAAAIIDAKWALYLPLYRQQDIFAGSGWIPSRSTLLNIVTQAAFVIGPLMEFMKQKVQGDVAVGLDDTSCRMLLPREAPIVIPGDAKNQRLVEKYAEAKAKKQKSLLAKMWAYSGLQLAPYNIFDFRVSRHRDGPDEFFAESRCTVFGDCFSGNTSVVIQSDERLTFAACWAHARRKFEEAVTYETDCDTMLDLIRALYDIETRGKEMTTEQRTALRQSESVPVLAAIRKWIDSEELKAVLPKSDFSEALNYLRNHWSALNVFSSDGRIPIDNNGVERLMRQVALGRKAWLFVGNVAAGEQSAMMMSLVSSAKRHDLDVSAYIEDVITQLLAGCTDYHSLLPDIWKQSHPEAVRQYRVEEREQKRDLKKLRAARRRLAAVRVAQR